MSGGFLNTIKWWLRLIFVWIVDSLKAPIPLSLLPKKSLNGQIVCITGAALGIGRRLAIEFGKQGCTVIIWDINEEKLIETAKILDDLNIKHSFYVVDVSNKELVYENAAMVRQECGDVDILVNCAGKIANYHFLDPVDERMEHCLRVNLFAHFYTLQAFLPSMQHKNQGHIVGVASYFGLFGSGCLPEYSSSKFGVVGLMESLRLHLKHEKMDGVKTTIVCPGYCSTDILGGYKCNSIVVPQMEPDYVAKRVVDAVRVNQELLIVPHGAYFLNLLHKIVPTRVADQLNLMNDAGYDLLSHLVNKGSLSARQLAPLNVQIREKGKVI
ncbi:Epidermal retinol dehydrogenase 2-like protein [Aphelenchoides besseyi]|nr:Epidermal retinol dehydrogenase 2-like protein [Aphelenchoides besseyi]KAI6194637.1 Epidermal retinol dehydrogenase 2-like protein [Aphelenchoides besseyi]